MREWDILRAFLLSLDSHGHLTYPFVILKGESPDFMFRWADGSHTGLELRRVTSPALEQSHSRREDREDREAPGNGPLGAPATEVMREMIQEAIQDKLAKMLRPGKWRRANRQDLLLHDGAALSFSSVDNAWQTLSGALKRSVSPPDRMPSGNFGVVSLLAGPWVVYDLLGNPLLLSSQSTTGNATNN